MTLSADRYFAIRHPMTFRNICSLSRALKIVVLLWILALGIMVPLILARNIHNVPFPNHTYIAFCTEKWTPPSRRLIYDACLFVLMFIVPTMFITTSYIRIGRQLWTADRALSCRESRLSRQLSETVMPSRRRVARLLVLLAILFAICWMPYHLLSLYLDVNDDNNNYKYTRAIQALPFTLLLGHFNSALNPILYYFMNSSFRKFCLRTFKCDARSRRRSARRAREAKATPVRCLPLKTSIDVFKS